MLPRAQPSRAARMSSDPNHGMTQAAYFELRHKFSVRNEVISAFTGKWKLHHRKVALPYVKGWQLFFSVTTISSALGFTLRVILVKHRLFQPVQPWLVPTLGWPPSSRAARGRAGQSPPLGARPSASSLVEPVSTQRARAQLFTSTVPVCDLQQ